MRDVRNFTAVSIFILSLSVTSIVCAETTGQYMDDSAITAKVKTALLADQELKALQISVTTTHGAVQLSGTVDTKTQESQAIKVANRVNGVQSVSDSMSVKNDQ